MCSSGMGIRSKSLMVLSGLLNQSFAQTRRSGLVTTSMDLQFHVEVTGEMIYQWIDAYRDEVDSLKGIVDPDQIIADTKTKSESYKAQARLFCSNFVKLI